MGLDQLWKSIIEVEWHNDIILYQKYMDGVDGGDQYCTVGAVFVNVSHLKNWFKNNS